ncbi:MAG: ribosome assembly RNA-binding protein YhbY [Clostridiales bacterium]|nr:ribosome assembly RNA-binding protein YhbY [Clostridiales bacterium]
MANNLTSKQRAYLKSLAVDLNPIIQIGKDSVTPENIASIDEAFNNRELIKISVLKNCADVPRDIAEVVAERTRSQVVQVIGRKIVLYRPDREKPRIILPSPKEQKQ